MLNIPEEVKNLFERNSVRKNIRIHFPNGERENITNSNLIAESFSFTESVMSQSEFRFGLCEASMVDFECFGVENIKGYEIEVYHEIDISSLGEEFISEYGMTSDDVAFPFYRVPYGRFTVDECLRQSDMVKRKVTAYGNAIKTRELSSVEKQKIQYFSIVQEGQDYDFDVFKLMASNLDIKKDFFSNMTKLETEETIYNIQGLAGTNKNYSLTISVYADQYYMSGENTDKLYLLKAKYNSDNIINELLEFSNGFIDTCETYGFNYDRNEIIEIILRDSYPWFANGNAVINDVPIKNNELIRFIYPYMSYINENTLSVATKIEFSLLEKGYIVYSDSFTLSDNKPELYEVDTSDFISIRASFKKVPFDADFHGYSEKLDFLEICESYCELCGGFGVYDRNGEFEIRKIDSNFGLYPSEDLYPSETLYPRDPSGGILTQGNYLSAWYDDSYTKPYSRIYYSDYEYWLADSTSINYKKEDYLEYSLDENILLNEGNLSAEEIEEILQTVGESLRNIRYMPCDIDAVGMPWVEAGDALEIITNDGGFETLVLNRRINGIQSLTDNITAD